MDKLNVINQISLFDSLNVDQKSKLMDMMESHVASRFSFIYHQDELADSIFILAKGSIKVGTVNEEGKEIIKHILHPEMVFGEMALIDNNKHRNFAMSLKSDVRYYKVKSANFKELMRFNGQLSMDVMNLIGKRLVRAETMLENLIFKDARERIIDFLRDNAEQRGRQVGFETLFKHSLTQQDIANLTGTSRQTVTSVMNELRKSNQIYFNRKSVLIRDLATLS